MTGLGMALVILLYISISSYRNIVHNNEDRWWVAHTRIVLEELDAILFNLTSAEMDLRGYILTGEAPYLKSYEDDIGRMHKNVKKLHELTIDNPKRQDALHRLEPLIKKKLAAFQGQIDIRRRQGLAASTEAIRTDTGKPLMDLIRALVLEMRKEEELLLTERSEAALAGYEKTKAVIVLGNISAFLFLFAAGFIINREINRRNQAEEEFGSSEERFRLIVENIVDYAIFMLDPEGHVISWNNGAERIKGYRVDEILGRHFACFYPREDIERGKPQDELKAAAAAGRTEDEGRRVRKDGTTFWANALITAIKDKNGNLRGFVKITRDMTKHEETLEEIRQLNVHLEGRTAQLSAANAELEAFSYSVAHDLRAPLRQIAGFSKILTEEHAVELLPAAVRYLEKIQEGAEQMGHLVDDLLNFARVGQQALSYATTSLNSIVQSAIEELETEGAGRDIEWRIDDLSTVECDPVLIKQVFVNLLSNALKYTRKRERALIYIGQTILNNQPILFVRDNGVGFEMKYAGKLFGIFQRLHKARDFEGTGVGLAIVDRIVRKHGGRIWAEAELEKGATFFFTLAALSGGINSSENKELTHAASN